MEDRSSKSNQELIEEIFTLKRRIEELEQAGSEHRRVEGALRESEEKYRRLVENASEAIFVAQDGRLVFANRAASQYTGYTVHELTARPFLEFIHHDDRGMVMERYLSCLKGEEVPVTYTFRVVCKDGQILWGELTAILIDWEGKGATLNFMIPITERMRFEEALRESENMQRTLLANLPAGVIIIDPVTKTIEEVNNAAAEMFGAEAGSIIGHRCHAFLCPASEGACPVCDLGQEVDNAEREMIRTNGARHPVLKSVKRIQIKGQEKLLECFIDITDRAKADRELKNAHSRLERILKFNEALLSAIPTPVFYKDREGRYVGCNRAFTEVMGVASEQIKGKTVMELWPSEHAEMYHRKDLQLMQNPARQIYEFKVRDKDGKDRMVIFAKDVFLDESGLVAGIIGAFLDITDQKLAENAVRLNESRLEALLILNQMAEESIAEITSFALEEAVRLTRSTIGYLAFLNEDESVLTMHSWSKTAMKDCAMEKKPIHYRVMETGLWGEAVRQRKPVITNDYSAPDPCKKGYPDGHVRVTRHMNVPIFAESRIVVVAGVGNKEETYNTADVQQLTLLMEGMWRLIERKRAGEQILAEREKLKTLSDNAPFGMVLLDKEGRFTYVNEKFTALFGYTISDIPDGGTWFKKAYPDAGYRHTVIATWLDDLEDASPGQRKPRTFTVTCKGGAQKIIHFIPSVLVSGDYLMTCEDITELKHLENQLRQAQKMEAIGTLAGGIAHDFNNILTAMTGYAALIQKELDALHPLRPYVDQVLSASKKATDLTGRLLAFSRKQPTTLVPLNINRTIKETEKLLRRLLTDDIELHTSFARDDAIAMADKSQIDQILFNLATNARDAMPKGGTLTIKTSLAVADEEFIMMHGFGEHGRYVEISVSDTGTGMDETTRENIFDPFFTTKEVGKGTGLGLATVYGIVKQHNGYIAVDSAPNQGTIFHVYLPVVEMKADEMQDTAPPLQRGKETVLIAEDNEDVRSFMREVLQQYGYETLEAADGEDAIETFRQHRDVDLIIVDSVMPKKNGREVYETIHGIDPHIKVLFTSGYTKDIILDKGIEEKEFDFIAKPLSLDNFLRKVREVLDRT
jgi:PAS domain S-box-containing protein